MVNESLTLDNSQIDRLKKLSISSLPFESCALLIGEKIGNENIVKDILPLNNSFRSSVAFIIDPDELFDAYQKSKRLNLDIISIFHSHPSIPYPSASDLKYMEINPVIWLIYSTTKFSFKAFLLSEEKKIIEVLIDRIKV